MRLILASTSPRRHDILALLGVSFDVVAPTFDEEISSHLSIAEDVLDIALGKARSVAAHQPNSIVIGSDTMISLEEQKFGKPADRADAARILRALSGKTHQIYTSVAIIDGYGGPGLTIVERVLVRMHPYTELEIQGYLACNESWDKAGAYSIQGEGRHLIAAIHGDYLAAVGLPLKPVADYLMSRGISVPLNVDQLYGDKAFLNWSTFD